ncbi:hypothetical protein ADL22_12600 [Streptomyces sp. NRRL F-4489]|uniref:hypothetical protein n=1 Tax=Streptomyces sp. NRRL F-4489 TaxID=1609095 RepID=UPI0007488669|nr:hypothetical protein [Streptomyces sp. NRRL F-4489]KUL44776.1 hypothetical protein ADL22_12600 [Streptomyces sp. NRRL F-4489]
MEESLFTESEIRTALEEQRQWGWGEPQDSLQTALMDIYGRQNHDATVVAVVVSYLIEHLHASQKGLWSFANLDAAERAFQRTYTDAVEVAMDWADEHWDGFNEVGGSFFDYEAFGKYLVSDSPDVFITEPNSGQLHCFWSPDNIPSGR